jgi:hypothetical protein
MHRELSRAIRDDVLRLHNEVSTKLDQVQIKQTRKAPYLFIHILLAFSVT